MGNEHEITMPFLVHDADMARIERTNKRLWILCIVLIALLFGTNAGWLYYESQYEYYEITQKAESETGNALVNNDGSIIYGK